jgi:hypothetical protein
MKTAVRTLSVAFVFLFLSFTNVVSQNKVVVKENSPKGNVVVVKHKNHVKKVKVYHPRWSHVKFHRRWVYFPSHNFYWDNHRNVYVIRTGTVWVVSKSLPNELKKVDLSKEKCIELSEDADEQDSIQEKNEEHLKQYKGE